MISVSGVDPYGGRRRITDEARIRESVTQTVLKDIQARARNQPVKQQSDKQQKAKVDKKQKQKTVCPDFNSPAGCGNPKESCPKGVHKCNRTKNGYACWRAHSAVNCNNPKMA